MERSFQHLWQDEGLSDVDVQLVLEGTTDQPKPKQLAKMPAHRVLLSLSPMLRAQLLRWDTYRQKPPTSRPADQKPASDQNDDNSKPQIVLTLQDPEQQPAALAVLKSLYATKPLPELLAELPQVQQLQADVLADMWEVPGVSTAVVDSLTSCAADSNLSDKAEHGLLAMPAHPDCLQPLVKCVLMSKFGDLEAAWADAALQEMLLGLPLHLMEQLLSYDDIQVHSEETVLYTAQEYVNQLPQQAQPTAASRLAPLIRCTHLSTFWLSTSAASCKAAQMVLYSQHTHIQKLVMLRLATRSSP